MTAYLLKLKNATSTSYQFGVYQKFPKSAGLQSIAWQVRGVPAAGAIPSTAQVDWKMQYGVAITNFDADNGKYTGEQVINADLSNSYEVVLDSNHIPNLQLTSPGIRTVDHDEITLKNSTDAKMDLGFTVANNLISATSAEGGETVQFRVHPTYYIAIFRDVQLGSLVDSDVLLGPVEVEFKDGYTVATVEAVTQAGTSKLLPPVLEKKQ